MFSFEAKNLANTFINLKGLKNKNLVAFPKAKLFVENLHKGKKQYPSKTKGLIIYKLLNEFTQNEVHCGRLHYF